MDNFDTPKRDFFLRCTEKRILGRGSYGVVFKATYKEQKVAVKIISKHDSFKFSSLSRERNILTLNHDNIVRTLKIVETKDYGAVIMERFYCGRSLQFILDHCEKIDLLHRLIILRDIGNALKFCHRNGIIHRDLKPDNLMLILNSQHNEYICKLFDFGCSYKQYEEHRNLDDILSNDHSRDDNFSTSILGTVRYSAPELLQGSIPNDLIDVYSYGILMWQLKENSIPYESIKSNEIIIWQVVKNNLRPDSTILKLNEKLHGKGEFRRDNSNKINKVNLLSPGVFKTSVKSFTPNKQLKMIGKKSSKSDFKHDKCLSKCALRGYQNITRKSLFQSKFLDSFNDESKENDDDIISIYVNLLTDHDLYLRKGENLFRIENEYMRMYKACWDENYLLRPSVEKICSLIEKFINYLL